MRAISREHDDYGSAWRQKDLDLVLSNEFTDLTHSAAVSYKMDWAAEVGIQEANGVAYTKESPDYKKHSKPPSKGE